MRNLQALINRSTINFPNPLNENQVEDVFEYLAKNLIEVNYQMGFKGAMNSNDPKNFFKEKYCSKIFGNMTDLSKKNHFATDSFECSNEMLEENYFKDINFQIIPGYELEEHSKENVQLWDKVRNLTQQYFSEHIS